MPHHHEELVLIQTNPVILCFFCFLSFLLHLLCTMDMDMDIHHHLLLSALHCSLLHWKDSLHETTQKDSFAVAVAAETSFSF